MKQFRNTRHDPMSVLAYIELMYASYGHAPTQEEIDQRFGFKSRYQTEYILKQLEGLGYIEIERHKKRGIRLGKRKRDENPNR